MKYTYDIYPAQRILSVKLQGGLYTDEVTLMDKEIRLKANGLNYKIVYDFRKTTNHISVADAYYWFVAEYNKMLFDLKYIPVAKITNEQDRDFFDFFGLTATNKGCIMKICKDETSAFQWLEQF
ncbi:MAG TPA: hypothetical protein VI413_02995 [Paludibacter sp.]